MDKKLIRIILSSLIFLVGVILQIKIWWVNLIIFLAAYFIVSFKIIIKAFKNIMRCKFFDENLLMLIASIGAFCINEYAEGVLVILLYSIGEYLQSKALKKSRNAISMLMKMKPSYANLKIGNEIKITEPSKVEIGNVLIIKKGEKIPIDCIVTKGESFLDISSLTGESMPKNVKIGDEILSGSINLGEMIEVKTIRKFEDSAISKILSLIENSNQKKSNTEKFITKFAKYYTPIVFMLAVVVAFIPPLILGFSNTFSTWLYRALVFLVVSCPCALVISIPLSFFGGIGSASKYGILIKGSEYIEKLAKVNKIIFDKTGTLTKGMFKIKKVVSLSDVTEEEILRISSILESFSDHPISKAFDKTIIFDKSQVVNYKENIGYGISAEIRNVRYYLGSNKFMEKNKIKSYDIKEKLGTVLYLSKQKRIIGYIIIGDELKDNIKIALKNIYEQNINELVMITGDNFEIAHSIANEIGISKIYANQLPEDKLKNLEKEMKDKKSVVAYVGDGVNDVPVLVRSDIGISMGNIGSDSAIEFSDVVIANDDILSIATGIKIARKTIKIAKQNIIFSLCVKIIAIILSTMGILNMWLAIFADVGVTFLAILNSLRLIKRMNNTQ